MNGNPEYILLTISLLLFLSSWAGRPSYRYGVPMLLLFLAIGIFAGSEGVLGIEFDNPKIAQFVGTICLNFILFSGGLETRWSCVKPILKQGVILSTLGVMLTALSCGVFIHYITDLTLFESLLLGSIISSTDAAAVFSILRSKNLSLKNNLRPTLEFESGSNDPMANVLTITFLTLVQMPSQPLFELFIFFVKQLALGCLMGFVMGKISLKIINKIEVSFHGLYPILVISIMFFTYASTNLIGGNGFLAIYICSVFLGNNNFIHKTDVLKMFDGFSWLMQIILFLTLGLLAFPSKVMQYAPVGLAVSIFLIVVSRPISVLLCLLPFKIGFKSKAYLSWVGLRGAVPIVFATYPMVAGLESASVMFNVVFFVSVSSVLIQGTSLSWVAWRLNVAEKQETNIENPADQILAEHPMAVMKEISIEAENPVVGKKIIELDFPGGAIIAMIFRQGKYLTPNGATKIQEKDKLLVILESNSALERVHRALNQ